jgi:hypothetical protein
MKVTFKNWKCIAAGSYYMHNDSKAIKLTDEEDGSPVAMATVNIAKAELDNDEVFIKDYSENASMAEALVNANIIEPDPVKTVESGHVFINSYRLTHEALTSLW